jgi:CRISPR-associated protein Csx3
MVNFLPAILVGGPPHAGKSVLFYHLTQAVRERHIPHHAIRACPDGEGNWFHEGEPETVTTIRVKIPGEWPASFVERMCQDLEARRLPFLVDMGGRPQSSQMRLFRLCTHSILLLRQDRPEDTQRWQHLVVEQNLLPLARLFSQREGDSLITARSPLLEGTLTGLERHTTTLGPNSLFEELVQRVAVLFASYNLDDIEQTYLQQSPTELSLNLVEALRTFTTTSTEWEPTMLQPFLESIPARVPLSVYGVGPNWLYAALAAHADPQPFYLFDPKLPFGWVQPLRVCLGTERSADFDVKADHFPGVTVLKIAFPHDRLEYLQPEPLAFPHVPTENGVIFFGRSPYWLLTALVRLYKEAGVPWIAPFYVQSKGGVVVYSHVDTYHPGDIVPLPATK